MFNCDGHSVLTFGIDLCPFELKALSIIVIFNGIRYKSKDNIIKKTSGKAVNRMI